MNQQEAKVLLSFGIPLPELLSLFGSLVTTVVKQTRSTKALLENVAHAI